MPSRRNRNVFSSHTRRPDVSAGLYFLERLIVVDVLWPIVKIDNDFGVAVWQETVYRMRGIVSIVVNEVVDKLIKRKPGNVSLENHLVMRLRNPVKAPNMAGRGSRRRYYHPSGRHRKDFR